MQIRKWRVLENKFTATFEILTAVKMSMPVFWVVTPCGLVGRYQLLRGTYCVHIHFSPEYGGSMFLRNAGIYLQDHIASQSRIPT
jgi:hypothetical protein